MAMQQITKHPRLILCLLAALAAPNLCAAAAGAQMRPGEWEVTVKMAMPGMPPQATHAPAMTQCVTPELAANPGAAFEKLNNRKQDSMKCTLGHYDTSGNKASWSIECTGRHPAHMDGEITYDSDSAYHGTTRMAMQGAHGPMIMTQEIEGHRIGDCKP